MLNFYVSFGSSISDEVVLYIAVFWSIATGVTSVLFEEDASFIILV